MNLIECAWKILHTLITNNKILEPVPMTYDCACISAPTRPWSIFSSQEMYVLSKGQGWDLQHRPQIFESDIPHPKLFLCTSFQTRIGVLVSSNLSPSCSLAPAVQRREQGGMTKLGFGVGGYEPKLMFSYLFRI